MKTQRATLIVGLCSLLALPAAMAADGQIDFVGEIKGTTCEINGGTPDFQVDLPSVTLTALSAPGQGAGRTPFDIRLSNCTPDSGRVMTYFEPGPTVNPLTGRLLIDGGVDQATEVEVSLLNVRHEPMDVSKGAGEQNSQAVDLVDGNARLDYFAEYVAVGAVTPGLVQTRILYSIVHP